jgi:hypothetical protein
MIRLLKTAVRRLIGEQAMGTLDYLRFPNLGCEFGAFNGQPARRQLFELIVERIKPAAVIETGTAFGATTQFMAQTKLPIFSVEEHPRRHGFARAKFRRQRNVMLFHQDSRSALRTLFDGALSGLTSRPLFFYLDAHWNEDLPLAEELEIILQRCSSSVIMLDDFQVPNDAGYRYDDYGPGKALTADYIAPAITAHGLCAFYPTTHSSDEGGARRGCVVLVKDIVHVQALASLPLLRAGS